MARLRVQLDEEQQRIGREERSSHPNPRIRERMLALWLLHHGVKRQGAADIVGVSRPPCSGTWPRSETGAWTACGGGTPIAR